MKLTFVHLTDPILFDPGTAALASIARRNGHDLTRHGADYGTDTARLLDAVLGDQPDLAVFRIDGVNRAVVEHVLGKLRERAADLPVALHGTACERPRELPLLDERVIALLPDAAAAFEALLEASAQGLPATLPGGCVRAGEEGVRQEWQPGENPLPEIACFGGAGLYRHGTSGSFFGEVGVAALETRIGSAHGVAPDAGLAHFNQPTTHGPRPYSVAAIRARLDELGEAVRHIEIHDRAFGEDPARDGDLLAGMLPDLGTRTLTLRVLAGTVDPSLLQFLDPTRVRRIVLELWAASPPLADRLPALVDPADVQRLAAAARNRGLDVGLLVPVGLPFETPQDVDAKISFIRSCRAARVRFLPFEPVIGTALHDLCVAESMLPSHSGAWNREVYSPLEHDGMPSEDWFEAWQRCLDLQAELQLAGGGL